MTSVLFSVLRVDFCVFIFLCLFFNAVEAQRLRQKESEMPGMFLINSSVLCFIGWRCSTNAQQNTHGWQIRDQTHSLSSHEATCTNPLLFKSDRHYEDLSVSLYYFCILSQNVLSYVAKRFLYNVSVCKSEQYSYRPKRWMSNESTYNWTNVLY